MQRQILSKTLLERIPVYLHYLRRPEMQGVETISSVTIAKGVKLGEVLVRKDLAAVSGAGKPRVGYNKDELIEHLSSVLNRDNTVNAVVLGAGKIGQAMLEYDGFAEYGLNIVAAFDTDPEKVRSSENGKPILSVSELSRTCAENNVKIGIVAVPEASAQKACDLLVGNGVGGIWNFSPIRLDVPERIFLRNENLAASLAALSAKLKKTD